jgi:hypothetical protein
VRPIRIALLSATMMASGAGLFAAVQRARTPARPNELAELAEPPAGRHAARWPVVVVSDPKLAAASDRTALSDRLAAIEAKLDALAGQARDQPADPGVPSPRPDERTAEQQQGMDEASRIVEAAMSRGSWLDGDQSRIREVGAQLLPGDRFVLKMKLAAAANERRLRDFSTQPFFF